MFTDRDRKKCDVLFEKYYAGRHFHDRLYEDMIRKYLRRNDRVLDVGCGRYLRFCKSLSDTAEMVGIDLDTVLETKNDVPPFGARADVTRLPFRDGHFDMVISRSVIEHLPDPVGSFREIARVLRPGGSVVVITPNKYDYVSVLAAFTPYWVHRALVSRIFRVPEDDVFPTLYRANTRPAMQHAMGAAGLRPVEVNMINHYPAYLMFSPVLFRLGVAYERLTSRRSLAFLRGNILSVFQKPAVAAAVTSREQVGTAHAAR